MSNLSNIGFQVDTNEDLVELINFVDKNGIPVDTHKGTYLYFGDKSGAEIWVQVDKADEFIGFQPFFKGESRRELFLEDCVERTRSELDGALVARFAAEDAKQKHRISRFAFDMPNYFLFTPHSFPRLVSVQLSAFAQTLSYATSAAEFCQKMGIHLDPNHAGITKPYYQLIELTRAPISECLITGEIVKLEKRTNMVSKQSFYWLFVRTVGGEVDVVVDPKMFEIEPAIGGVLSGRFWLTATVVN